MNVYDKLKELGITLPPVATPAAAYVPSVAAASAFAPSLFASVAAAEFDLPFWA